jgi:hypothetical protein
MPDQKPEFTYYEYSVHYDPDAKNYNVIRDGTVIATTDNPQGARQIAVREVDRNAGHPTWFGACTGALILSLSAYILGRRTAHAKTKSRISLRN